MSYKGAFLLLATLFSAAQSPLSGNYGISSPVQSFNELETLTISRPATVIFPVETGLWNTSQSYDPCVPDPSADPLVLIFTGMGSPVESGPQRIGKATATRAAFLSNPLTAWVQDSSNPTMVTGASGQPDSAYIRQSSCFYNPDDGGNLWEYYTCNNGTADQMCLATSTDQGHTWSKYGVVMNPTIDGCSDETWVSQGAVMRRGAGDYIMVYSWRNPGSSVILPGSRYVKSADGKHWNPGTCTNSLTVAPQYLEQHNIFMLGGRCVMLYETGNNTVPPNIGFASAATCEGPFAVSARSPFLAPSGTSWDATIVACPFLFTVDGVSYLWYCGTNESPVDYNVDHYPMSLGTYNIFSFVP